MVKMSKNSFVKKSGMSIVLAAVLVVMMALPCAAGIRTSANKVYKSSVRRGGEFALTGYFYYSNDTKESITLDYFGFSCKNTSTDPTLWVNSANYKAYNGKGFGNSGEGAGIGDDYDDPTFRGVAPGELASHKSLYWETIMQVGPNDNVYYKFGNPCIFEINVGFPGGDNATHQLWSYADCSYKTYSKP